MNPPALPAARLTHPLRSAFNFSSNFRLQASPPSTRPTVAFLEWTSPVFIGGHWTPQLIHMAGGAHPLNPPAGEGLPAGKSVAIESERVRDSDPDWIVVCPCGLDIPTTR